MTQAQMIASIKNKLRDAKHEMKMATDPKYRRKIEKEAKAYEEFIAKYGEPLFYERGRP